MTTFSAKRPQKQASQKPVSSASQKQTVCSVLFWRENGDLEPGFELPSPGFERKLFDQPKQRATLIFENKPYKA